MFQFSQWSLMIHLSHLHDLLLQQNCLCYSPLHDLCFLQNHLHYLWPIFTCNLSRTTLVIYGISVFYNPLALLWWLESCMDPFALSAPAVLTWLSSSRIKEPFTSSMENTFFAKSFSHWPNVLSLFLNEIIQLAILLLDFFLLLCLVVLNLTLIKDFMNTLNR